MNNPLVDSGDIAALKTKIKASGLSVRELVATPWASTSTFRGAHKRGGASGARVRLTPQKDRAVNEPAELAKVLETLQSIQREFDRAAPFGKRVSLADLIVLGGCGGVVQAAKSAGGRRHRAITPGRMDASQAQAETRQEKELDGECREALEAGGVNARTARAPTARFPPGSARVPRQPPSAIHDRAGSGRRADRAIRTTVAVAARSPVARAGRSASIARRDRLGMNWRNESPRTPLFTRRSTAAYRQPTSTDVPTEAERPGFLVRSRRFGVAA